MDINDRDKIDDSRKELTELIHFIRTPIAAIKMGSEILKEYFPILVESYKNSGEQRSNEKMIGDEKMDKLSAIINNILIEAHRISDYTKKIEDNAAIQQGLQQ